MSRLDKLIGVVLIVFVAACVIHRVGVWLTLCPDVGLNTP